MQKHPKPLRLKRMVEIVLQDNPKFNGASARDSDITLMLVIWQRWYSVGTNHDTTIHITRLYDLPTQENVKRWRAKFQNDLKLYPPDSWIVARARNWLIDEWRAALGYKPTAAQMAEVAATDAEYKAKIDNAKAGADVGFKTASAICARDGCDEKITVQLEFGKPIKHPLFCSLQCKEEARRT